MRASLKAVLAGMAFLAAGWSLDTHAQTEITLVENTNRTEATTTQARAAQVFRTGSFSKGYEVAKVLIGGAGTEAHTASFREVNESGRPAGNSIGALASPAFFSTGLNTFTAEGDRRVILEPNTNHARRLTVQDEQAVVAPRGARSDSEGSREGPFASPGMPTGPATIGTDPVCNPPVLPGGAKLLGGARKIVVGKKARSPTFDYGYSEPVGMGRACRSAHENIHGHTGGSQAVYRSGNDTSRITFRSTIAEGGPWRRVDVPPDALSPRYGNIEKTSDQRQLIYPERPAYFRQNMTETARPGITRGSVVSAPIRIVETEPRGKPSVHMFVGFSRRSAEPVRISGNTLVFSADGGGTGASRVPVPGDGSHTLMEVTADSLALNGGTVRSQTSNFDAALVRNGAAVTKGQSQSGEPSGPTARFDSAVTPSPRRFGTTAVQYATSDGTATGTIADSDPMPRADAGTRCGAGAAAAWQVHRDNAMASARVIGGETGTRRISASTVLYGSTAFDAGLGYERLTSHGVGAGRGYVVWKVWKVFNSAREPTSRNRDYGPYFRSPGMERSEEHSARERAYSSARTRA